MNKPMCAKCNKPVDEIKMESHSIGFVVAAICHDKADVVVVPWEYMAKGLDPSRISYTGKAFEGK